MPAHFERDDVYFDYPENWALEEDPDDDARVAVSLFAPSGAFWSLRVENDAPTPSSIIDTALEAMRGEYDEIDVEEAKHQIEDHELIGLDMNFFCLDLTNTAKLRAMQTPMGTCLVFFQSEDRDWAAIEPVFWAITTSLLRRNRPDT